jgi:putative selenate reductase molybdopterin-binding subunit
MYSDVVEMPLIGIRSIAIPEHEVPGNLICAKDRFGCCNARHSNPIPGYGWGLYQNEYDGSFNMMVGATDLGTGSDTILGQMAAEILGVPLDDILVYSSDTDFTPFDKGAYASSTTYISGTAVTKAAMMAADRIKVRAAMMLSTEKVKVIPEDIHLKDQKAVSKDGRSVTMKEIGFNSLHHSDQEQIVVLPPMLHPSPASFCGSFAEVHCRC